MKKTLFLGIAVAAALMMSVPAKAVTYDFTFTGLLGDVVTGNFNTDALNNLTGISGGGSGPFASGVIGGLVTDPPNANPFFSPTGNGWTYNNTYDPVHHDFDGNGVLFTLGGGYANIYTTGGVEYISLDTIGNTAGTWNPGEIGQLDVSTTPLPAALPLMFSALGGGGLLLWRRKKKTSAMGLMPRSA